VDGKEMTKWSRKTKWIKPHIYLQGGAWRVVLRGQIVLFGRDLEYLKFNWLLVSLKNGRSDNADA